MSPEIYDEKSYEEAIFNLGLKDSALLTKSKEELEETTFSDQSDLPAYGALPYYKTKEQIISRIPSQLAEFGIDSVDPENTKSLRQISEFLLFFEMKNGFALHDFAERILASYPPIGEEDGSTISLFGLSGSGKSLAMEAIREKFKERVIVIDSDTTRFNLLAKAFIISERTLGKTAEEIKNSKIIHNRITGPLYFMLDYVTAELKKRGYVVVRAATTPYKKADRGFYIEHPSGIDPTKIDTTNDEEVRNTALVLEQNTKKRVTGPDDYDWENATLITKFENMVPVNVSVPLAVHERFIKSISAELSQNHTTRIKNPHFDDPALAKQNILNQLEL